MSKIAIIKYNYIQYVWVQLLYYWSCIKCKAQNWYTNPGEWNEWKFQGRIPRIQTHMFDLISSSDVIMIHPGGIKQTISQEQKNGCMDASQNWGNDPNISKSFRFKCRIF